jgi:DNA polymerase-3 subunit beta
MHSDEPARLSDPTPGLISIGTAARLSGLTVSALRFYDGAGVLVPDHVDPASGYRWYADGQVLAARVVARLRRVGMPVVEIREVLAHWPDSDRISSMLNAHLRRLEDGLSDARSELSAVHALLANEERHMTDLQLTVTAIDLARGLDAVRFAARPDHELAALTGILLEISAGTLGLVATDRYRLAVSELPASVTGVSDAGRTSVLAPIALFDSARELLNGATDVIITIKAGQLTIEVGGQSRSASRLDHDFPDYRRFTDWSGAGRVAVEVDAEALAAAVRSGAAQLLTRPQDGQQYEVVTLHLDADGTLAVLGADGSDAVASGAGAQERYGVAVNREFLLQALIAPDRGQLILELDGPIKPLAIRIPDEQRTFSILMPVNQD